MQNLPQVSILKLGHKLRKPFLLFQNCRTIYEEMTTRDVEFSKASVATTLIKTDDPKECCPRFYKIHDFFNQKCRENCHFCLVCRCSGIVYDAEKMAMRSGVYHKKCFNCSTCRRNLDYLLAVDGPGGDQVYCRSCYGKIFSPSEMRFVSI